MKLESVNDQIKIEYETELSKPNSDIGSGSSGSKSKSSTVVKLNSASTLFEISMKTTSLDSSEMPLLNKIPILGNLFKSKSNSENYKKIYAIIEVNPHE
jgi:type II secretory pathway component GspD/PulD (secretin)